MNTNINLNNLTRWNYWNKMLEIILSVFNNSNKYKSHFILSLNLNNYIYLIPLSLFICLFWFIPIYLDIYSYFKKHKIIISTHFHQINHATMDKSISMVLSMFYMLYHLLKYHSSIIIISFSLIQLYSMFFYEVVAILLIITLVIFFFSKNCHFSSYYYYKFFNSILLN